MIQEYKMIQRIKRNDDTYKVYKDMLVFLCVGIAPIRIQFRFHGLGVSALQGHGNDPSLVLAAVCAGPKT